ncbi:Uncharacterized conserved protein [Escherichia coli]|nr:DcrB-related protein [Escherichia coli]MCY6860834.1 DcrB-related protein [Escherichia coli]MDF8720223.1 DcrB-related protein [Escherichia coli]SRA67860.1 Uncharacterized conserved protein [Escherichia coli]SRA79837.1 Uncharacterized conserved protein [Escherichia coli]
MQFTFNEGHIQLPSQWQDQSMQVLVSTDNSGINLVINSGIGLSANIETQKMEKPARRRV